MGDSCGQQFCEAGEEISSGLEQEVMGHGFTVVSSDERERPEFPHPYQSLQKSRVYIYI
jgi:hypothetical protein